MNGWFVVNEPYQWHYHQSARNYVEVGHATADTILDAGFVGTPAP